METIKALKERIEGGTLTIQNEGGYISRAGFSWNDPIADMDIEMFERANSVVLPKQYKDFLKTANGAMLFEDMDYGQWGCDLLALDSLISETEAAQKQGLQLQKNWIVFAKWRGDGDLLVFDANKCFEDERDYIMDGDQGYAANEWKYLSGDFNTWLDRLVVAQGAKYWRWY